MVGPAKACLEFWQSMADTPFLKLHPSLKDADLAKVVPIGIHGDAGAFSKSDSLYTISWNSLLGQCVTARKRFVFTVLRKSDLVAGTLDAVFQILAWSLNTMLRGEAPSHDWEGHAIRGGGDALAGRWRAALCQARGDWAPYVEVFNSPQWNSAERMCWICRASSTIARLAWSRCDAEAGWRETRWTHEAYLAFLRGAGMAIPILLTCIVGFRLECVMVDVLHTVDQGVASHVIANVFWLFAVKRSCFGGGTHDEKIKKLFA